MTFKKNIFYFSILFIVIILAVILYFFNQKENVLPVQSQEEKSPEKMVGADRDEHGCIASAGYSWCEAKSKCLRIWEETCYENLEQEIQYLFMKKYNKDIEEIGIIITKQDGDYISGSVQFEHEVSGGVFLAMKVGVFWELVYDGNGSIDCQQMRQEYGFPETILRPNFCD